MNEPTTQKRTRFDQLTEDELRAMAAKTNTATPWHKYTRDMLLAFFHNRYGVTLPEVYL